MREEENMETLLKSPVVRPSIAGGKPRRSQRPFRQILWKKVWTHSKKSGLQAKNVSAYFGAKQAIRTITLTMPLQQVTAIIGPSGCGKSTFIRCLNRMHEVVPGARMEGQVLLHGNDIMDMDPVAMRRQVGMVFQKPQPFPTMSIFDNVSGGFKTQWHAQSREAGRNRGKKPPATRPSGRKVKDSLSKPGTRAFRGQQQRFLHCPGAWPSNPQVLPMDEPCSALDPIATAKIEVLILELKKNYTIVIVTHNLQQAARVSDNTAFFLHGRADRSRPARRRFSPCLATSGQKTTSQEGSVNMERHFDQDLQQLKERILYMGSQAETMIHTAIKSLVDRRRGRSKEVYRQEEEVNKLQIEIDDRSLKMIALHQPTASDLRFITAAMKINSDLGTHRRSGGLIFLRPPNTFLKNHLSNR